MGVQTKVHLIYISDPVISVGEYNRLDAKNVIGVLLGALTIDRMITKFKFTIFKR